MFLILLNSRLHDITCYYADSDVMTGLQVDFQRVIGSVLTARRHFSLLLHCFKRYLLPSNSSCIVDCLAVVFRHRSLYCHLFSCLCPVNGVYLSHYSSHYSARLTAYPNDILLTLLEQPERKRLQRHLPNDLPTRFMV
jgi:hypothetical protein